VSAFAEDAPETVRLDYQVDERCPTADAFLAAVHARSPRVRFTSDGERALVVRIHSAATTGEARSKLEGRIDLGDTHRVVTGATCAEVISALGLVSALALDPIATAGGGPAATTADPARANIDAGAPSAAPAKHTPSADERELPVESRTWSFAAGADGEVVFGASPDPMFAVPVFFEATRAIGTHFALGGALRFVHAGDTALTSGVGADFDWTSGAADLCAVFRAGRFRLDGCERTGFGIIDAHGLGALPSRRATRPWVTAGLAVALRARLAGPFFIEAAAHVAFAFEQDRFFLEPNVTVFQAPPLTGEVGGGVGFEIW
jgi:hypothetical protein